jgi:hypothetical protein
MNERIKELAKQAWIEVATKECHNGYEFGPNGEHALKSLNTTFEKFAELIVAECLAIAKNREDELESAGLLDESNAVGNVSYRISRQFGVKR